MKSLTVIGSLFLACALIPPASSMAATTEDECLSLFLCCVTYGGVYEDTYNFDEEWSGCACTPPPGDQRDYKMCLRREREEFLRPSEQKI